MKKMLLLLALAHAPLGCMGKDEEHKNESDNVQAGSEKEDFYRQNEVDKFLSSLMQQSKHARHCFLQMRIGEIIRENSIPGILGLSPLQFVAGSGISGRQETMVVHRPTKKIIPANTCMPMINMLAGAIAVTEQALIENNNVSCSIACALESTRINDVVLLTNILIHDNYNSTRDSVHTLPNILLETHTKWPPQHVREHVKAASAYTLIKAALEIRKDNKTDELPIKDIGDLLTDDSWRKDLQAAGQHAGAKRKNEKDSTAAEDEARESSSKAKI
ncbi:MAG: hypothetical protein NTX86_04350 [Candidatus Dependentiae bacterium]|nr:hypothetical protein [Candidatus Dependentiae bacterium]